MFPNPLAHGREAGPRHHWSVYVLLALLGGMLTFAGARAQQKASDAATFRELIEDCVEFREHRECREILCKGRWPDLLRPRAVLLPGLQGIRTRRPQESAGQRRVRVADCGQGAQGDAPR